LSDRREREDEGKIEEKGQRSSRREKEDEGKIEKIL
jgi:hypothetical protein